MAWHADCLAGVCPALIVGLNDTCACKARFQALCLCLCADKLSPFKFYQYLVTSVPDADVIRFLKMLTFLPLEEIEALQQSMGASDYTPNTAQRLLASEVTKFVHGEGGLQQALNATQVPLPCFFGCH